MILIPKIWRGGLSWNLEYSNVFLWKKMRMLRQVLFSFYFIFSFFFQCFFSRKNRFTNDVLHKSHKRLNEGSRLGTLPLYGWKQRQKANKTKVVLTSFLEDLSILCDLIFSWRPMEFWWIFWNKTVATGGFLQQHRFGSFLWVSMAKSKHPWWWYLVQLGNVCSRALKRP